MLLSCYTSHVNLISCEIGIYSRVGYQSSHYQLKEGHHLQLFPYLLHLEVIASGGG